ncbi:putative folate-biopterin transporter 8 [Hibiscus syriacus]|uniref:Folate-biopterin transporter 8 n=1 Tax=Hibiscus syriacus TaxID=106335 RepID=A0A6A3BXD0_HIBSY|nr:putative folate-biopterin transporter 8 [Hibiscus syriacus]
MSTLCGLGYWVQGFRCFPWLALNFHMSHNLKFNPSTLQLVQTSANLPMVAKPLYGILADAFYIEGPHRIPYICIGVLVQIISWGQLALIQVVQVAGQSLPTLMACVVLGNLGASIEDVSKDALVTEYGLKHRIKGLQSYSFMASAIGGILGNFLGGYFLLKLKPRTMFLVFSALLSLQLAISLSECIGLPLSEDQNRIRTRQSVSDNIRKNLFGLMIAIGEDTMLMPLTWIVTSIAMVPILSGPTFCYHTVSEPRSFSDRNVKIGQPINADVFRIPNEVFALCFCGLAETVAPFKILPFTILLATQCPRGCEGSFSSFLASILCLSSIVSGFWGVGLADLLGIKSGDYSSLPVGILIQFLAALLPLGWIHQLPMSHPVEKEIKKCIEETQGFEESLAQ